MTVEENIVTDTISALFAEGGAGPKYRVLAEALRAGMEAGRLAPGTRLPPVRELGWRLGMTPGTVARAYTILTDEGTLVAEVGRGTFVRGVPHAAQTPDPERELYSGGEAAKRRPGVVNLYTARLADQGQLAMIREAVQRLALQLGEDFLDYPNRDSYRPAREAACGWLRDVPLGGYDHEDLVLSYGAQGALSLVMHAVLKGRRPAVLVEELCYPGFRRAAEMLRAEVIAVPMDAEGIRPDALAELARKHDAQLLCTSPALHNPTTIVTPPRRRRAIAEVARKQGFQIVEDDCFRLGNIRTETYRALLPEQSWYISSISKVLSPALRIGFAIAPKSHRAELRRVAEYGAGKLAMPLARLAEDLLPRAETEAIARAVHARNAAYVRATVNVLGGHDLSWHEEAGFAWLRLPAGWRANAFCRAAESEGVRLRASEEFAAREAFVPHAVRVGMNLRIPLPEFEAALGRLRRLLDNPPEQILV